jgi:amino acid permease
MAQRFYRQQAFLQGQILYGLMVITAGIIYYRQSMKLSLPWYVNDYLNDLLCMPLVLGLLSSAVRYLKNDSNFQFSRSFIIGLALYYSVYFEYYLPEVNARYTEDWIDILLYFLGGNLFHAYHRTRPDKPD